MGGSNSLDPGPVRGHDYQVLLVADDPEVVDLLSTTLELAGYRLARARTGEEALVRLAAQRFDLVVFDVTLPGLERLTHGRRRGIADRPPVLFVTTCEALESLLPELGPGAQDYVTKPFRITEFLARAQVLLRGRHPGGAGAPLCYGDLVLDDALCQARRGQRPLDLTAGEYRLLRHLLVNAGTVLSKEQIARHLWGEFRGDNAIERLVSRLRHKVDGGGPALIHTRRGFGYSLGGRTAALR